MYNLQNKTTDIHSGKSLGIKNTNLKKKNAEKIFSDPFKITKDSTVQWFKSRINHKILAKTLIYTKLNSLMIQNVHSAIKQTKLSNIFYGNVNMSNDF